MSTIVKGRPHVVIVGGGFGGLAAAKKLAGVRGHVSLVDRNNHHVFQPLLYQVAMAGVSPADIASPIRAVLAEQHNTSVMMDEVVSVDLPNRVVKLRRDEVPYDFLILAMGAEPNYFGNEKWAAHAPGLKTIDDAIGVRDRVLLAFEQAEREFDPQRRAELLTFVVVGAGPTGVELAGALAELSRYALAKEFRSLHAGSTRVILLHATAQILPSFAPDVSAKAVTQLEELGVEVRTGTAVTEIDANGVTLGAERIASKTVIWAAGVKPTPIGRKLGVPVDRGGRVVVGTDLSLPGYPEVFAIGDMASFVQDGKPLPGVSAVAIQQGRSAAESILNTLKGKPRKPFRYFDKGSMATIGRSRAVAVSGRVVLSGFLAWVAWAVVHLWFLVGFRNRFTVLFNWVWSYLTYERGARLISSRHEAAMHSDDETTRVASRIKVPVAVNVSAGPGPVPSPSSHGHAPAAGMNAGASPAPAAASPVQAAYPIRSAAADDNEVPQPQPRRRALALLAGSAGASVAAVGLLPAASLFAQPGEQAHSSDTNWVRVMRFDSLVPGHPTKAVVMGAQTDAWTKAPDRPLGSVWLIREDDTNVRAYSTVCPHLGCAIEVAGDHFNCPCHDSAFSLQGARCTGPSPRGMDTIETRVEGGWVAVRYQRFRQGVAERTAI